MCFITVVVLFLACFGSSCSLHDDLDVSVNTLDRFKVHFNWRNISCPVCKAVFTIVDIALLVRKLSFVPVSPLTSLYRPANLNMFVLLRHC